jgi:predicted CopG family antitoxin
MATRTITIKEEAYNRLKELKHGKSFSDVILEITKDRNVDLMESFGTLSEEKAEEAREKIEEFRGEFNRDADEALRS